jgi:hypothetical protein
VTRGALDALDALAALDSGGTGWTNGADWPLDALGALDACGADWTNGADWALDTLRTSVALWAGQTGRPGQAGNALGPARPLTFDAADRLVVDVEVDAVQVGGAGLG